MTRVWPTNDRINGDTDRKGQSVAESGLARFESWVASVVLEIVGSASSAGRWNQRNANDYGAHRAFRRPLPPRSQTLLVRLLTRGNATSGTCLQSRQRGFGFRRRLQRTGAPARREPLSRQASENGLAEGSAGTDRGCGRRSELGGQGRVEVCVGEVVECRVR